MSESVKLSGFNELEKAMAELGGKIAKRVGVAAMKKALKPMLAEVRREVPEKTGAIKNAIKIRVGKSKNKSTRKVRVSLSNKFFTGDTFYAGFLEYGWKHGSRKLGDARKDIPGEHFMRNSWEETKGQVLGDFQGYLKEAIEKAAAKLAKK